MKTTRNTLSLLAATLLPVVTCSLASAQNTTQGASEPAAPAQNGQPACAHHEHKSWKKLTDGEREQLKADMQKIHRDPQLVAARQALKDAQTPEAKTAARTSLRQVRHDLLVKADPSIAPVLAKLKEGHKDKDE